MDPEEAARRELELVRSVAREGAPRRDAILPDPLRLPPLPPSMPAVYPTPEPRVGEFLPEAWYDEPSRSTDVWRDVWQRNVRFRLRSHRGLLGRLIVFLKRVAAPLVRAPLSADAERARIFNIALLNRVDELEREVGAMLAGFRDPYTYLRDRAIADLIDRSDALFGILDRRIDELEAEIGRVREQSAAAGNAGAAGVPAASPAPARESAALPGVFADDTYYSFETLHRGSEGEVRERQLRYVEVFRAAPGPVVDLGCGRGEMLQLLREAGISAYGVDANAAMAAACRRDGLEVLPGDAVAHLRELPDATLGGVFSAQTFEHWEREAIVEAVKLTHRKLVAGSAFVMETQNPRSIVVGASSFWRDPTHLRPLHPEAFEFLVRAVGFRDVEVVELAPWPKAERLRQLLLPDGLPEPTRLVLDDLNRVLGELDERLYGYRDYAVIARK